MLQIVLESAREFWTNRSTVTMEDMFADDKQVPGNIGFDPMVEQE
jgi:hypothetical protein